MSSVLSRLRIPIATIELIAWLPASCAGVILAAAYSVAGNEAPVTLMIGSLLVPITFVVGPVYALTRHARARPVWTIIALTLPLVALALTWVAEARSLTFHPS